MEARAPGYQAAIGLLSVTHLDSKLPDFLPPWIVNLNKPDLNSVDNFISNGHFQCAVAQVASPDLNGTWGFVNYANPWLPAAVLGTMMLVQFVFILVLLKRRDSV